MTTPQDPPKRNKQKRRRTKKLAEWREKNAAKTETKAAPAVKAPVAKAPVAKAPVAKKTAK
jgi:hypothetical protein